MEVRGGGGRSEYGDLLERSELVKRGQNVVRWISVYTITKSYRSDTA